VTHREPLPGTIASLEAAGFSGFLSVRQLHDERCLSIPNERGVYAVVRESLEPPTFLPRSRAPVWRGMDPTRPAEELTGRWVPGAQVLYFGRARGPGVRSLLRQRVKRYLRFGQGRVVAHWGGRFVWQLEDADDLLVAWLPTGNADPWEVEAELQRRFREHHGRLPFANLIEELDDTGADDGED
jgi:hypothetical protein